MTFDASVDPVVIIGGGVVGSAVATFLAAMRPGWRVIVIERDPTYEFASSALSASSIRQQFSSPINIAISRFGMEFLRSIGGLGLVEKGYLYLATQMGEEVLRSNHAVQRAQGADVLLMSPRELQSRYGWLNTEGIALGSLGVTGEGWFDGYSLLQALRSRAVAQGVEYRKDTAAGFDLSLSDGVSHVGAVRLASGERIACSAAVNAAGAWARPVARWAGIDLPVHGRCRSVFHFTCPANLDGFPLLIDPSGIWVRPEGSGFIAGFSPPQEADPDDAPLDVAHAAFDDHVWPLLAERIPAFEAVRLKSSWAGYYEMNVFDHNAIVGLHPACDNLYFANGFSGHGLQQSPGVGRGIAELIATGNWQTLELGVLGFGRILRGEPLVERNII
jgi:glycine/D-amino acid oxidase-like deaminating enzyme